MENAIRRTEPGLIQALASLGFLGCVTLIVGTLVAQIVVPGHDWIADTISDLGAGRWEIIMDVALYGFATGLMATALAAAHCHPGGRGWSVGIMSLAVLAGIVVVIAARNEYGDGDHEGVVIHVYLVYGLGLFFALAAFTMASGLRAFSRWAGWALIALGVLWTVASPVFFFLPTDVDGIYERALGLVACAILAVLNSVFFRQARS